MKIVVLAGGLSSERDVSLSSSGRIANALTENGHQVLVVDSFIGLPEIDSFEALSAKYHRDDYSCPIPAVAPDLEALQRQYGVGGAVIGPNVLEACRLADVVFIGLHGAPGENGQVQAMLDMFGVVYTGSGFASSLLAMDKVISKQLITLAGVPTAPYQVFDIAELSAEELLAGLEGIGLPFVVKPRNGGSSVGVTIVKTAAELAQALAIARVYETEVLVEPYIAGREFSVGVLGDRVLPAIEVIPPAEFFDYASKYQGTSSEICPADIPQELETALRAQALKAHRTLGLGSYSRADFRVDAQGNLYWLETNSLPGMSAASLVPQEAAVAGIGYNELCEMIVALAIAK
ncbi:MAG: D-alanine--D-alanine ligase [Propionibacteriaceae bacterium]|nr:D-alanine--D-alanine ligase [Propionibacteriaceae bacterium]